MATVNRNPIDCCAPQHYKRRHAAIIRRGAGADYYPAVKGGLTVTKTLLTDKPEAIIKIGRATLRAARLL